MKVKDSSTDKVSERVSPRVLNEKIDGCSSPEEVNISQSS